MPTHALGFREQSLVDSQSRCHNHSLYIYIVNLTAAVGCDAATDKEIMSPTPTIDAYLATLPPNRRAALQKLREVIQRAAPEAKECFSYGMPSFRFQGKLLISFREWTNHYGVYPGSYPVKALEKELAGYETSKGTVRFPWDKPLPVALVRKLVQARVAEIEEKRRAPAKPSTKTPAPAV